MAVIGGVVDAQNWVIWVTWAAQNGHEVTVMFLQDSVYRADHINPINRLGLTSLRIFMVEISSVSSSALLSI